MGNKTGVDAAPVDAVVIQPAPPRDGNDWDCQCARCGSSCDYERCEEWDCQDGYVVGVDDLDECDEITTRKCDVCNGRGGWNRCLSSREWCEANPLPGREKINRGQIEWFRVAEVG